MILSNHLPNWHLILPRAFPPGVYVITPHLPVKVFTERVTHHTFVEHR